MDTRRFTYTTWKLFAVAACSLWSSTTFVHAQTSGISIAPLDPTLSVGQIQQFTATNAVKPTGVSSGGEYTCLGLSDGTVRCTGRNQFGQLANGTFENSSVLGVSSLTNISRVAAGDEFACALVRDGTVTCWGLGESGQRGDGTFTTFSSGPVSVNGLSGAVALGSGYAHACALLADATVRCWGEDIEGELGNGTTATPGIAAPVQVVGIAGAQAIATGSYHTCALLSNSSVKCWGRNDQAQLGDGTATSSSTPVDVSGLNGVTALAGGGAHTCALRSDGTIYCWGDNEFGEIGDGTTARAYGPVQVVGVNDAIAIAAGWRHTCALRADGTVWCWGQNACGQLGDGTTNDSSVPVKAVAVDSAVDITAGWWHHSCALRRDGSVRCWGENTWGQLGNGTTVGSPLAVSVTGTGVTWTSSNTAIATIDSTGLAHAVNSGATTITATDTSGAAASTTLRIRDRAALSVVLAGAGAGAVTSAPGGISCGTDCAELYDVGTTVTLTASPDNRSTFAGWSGCDSVSAATCTVTINAATTVTAAFNLKRFTLTVNKTGLAAGNGSVTSRPQGINCGTSCSSDYTIDTSVTLTAAPDLLFTGWTGCDTVAGTVCTVNMNANRSVTAKFVNVQF